MKPETYYYNNGQVESETWLNEAGDYHKLDGPAYRYWYRDGQLKWEVWRVDGQNHRLDGPAYQGWYSDGRTDMKGYWINGVRYETEAEFLVAVDLYKANEIADLF